MIPALNDLEYFRAATVRAPAAEVDSRGERILGAKIIQSGDVNDGRPVTIDLATLEQVAEYGNRINKGIKARFSHPSMSDDGLGRYLGRWKNFRVEGDAVLADLYVAASAHDTPEGDLAQYVLDLAQEDPEAFGVSIVSQPDGEAMEALQAELPDGARVPLRITKLRAADFVDEPAATRGGLFSMNPEDPRALAPLVSKILDEHFGDCDPEDVLDRFARMLSRHYNRRVDMPENTTIDPEVQQDEVALAMADKTPAVAEACTQVECATGDEADIELLEASDPNEFLEAFGDRGARWYLEGLSLGECYRRRCLELQELCENLEARLNIALSQIGEAEPVSASIELSKEEARKLAMQAKIEEDLKRGIPESVSRWSRAFGGK